MLLNCYDEQFKAHLAAIKLILFESKDKRIEMSVKEHLKQSEDLEKQLQVNKSTAKDRSIKLDRLDEATKLLDESSQKYNEKAIQLERHFEAKWRRYLIGFGLIVGSVVLLGFGGSLFGSDNNRYDYSRDN